MDLQTELAKIKKDMTEAPFDGKAAEVILFLVSETLDALERGIETAGFERGQIVVGCVPVSKVDQIDLKSWMPKEDQLRRVLASHTKAVELVYKQGRGRGIFSNYRLKLLDDAVGIAEDDSSLQCGNTVQYTRTPADEIKPIFLLRPFLSKELKNHSWRGVLFLLGFIFGGAVLTVSVPLLLLLWLVYGSSAVELKQILALGVVAVIYWFVWRQVYEPFFRLIDSRVVQAPAWVSGLTEDPCELEMYRQADGQWTRLVRFSGECTLCGGRVELKRGAPEHAYPLVGRCNNSPHAHVYSFDRMLLNGSYIGPPVA
ncbi:hypothetical protein ACS8E9_19000 [Pseudomonas neustonica]|uniref:hypothetical protein n=1 Tax=Pseudomonas neustonica TaxID=2487346 RepID=UPI003F4528B6